MTDHTELIARLEAATYGSRELDDGIAVAVGGPGVKNWEDVGKDSPAQVWRSHPYTTSLDAWLMLVPENHRWVVGVHTELGNYFAACQPDVLTQEGFDGSVNCPTPALAGCIAALKAREKAAPD